MRIITSKDLAQKNFSLSGAGREEIIATIGFFDGVHLGHVYLLSQVMRLAKERNGKSLAVTFSRHPLCTLKKDFTPQLLTTNDEKMSLLENLGIDYCCVLDFTPELAKVTSVEFMQRFLVQKLGVSTLLTGHDHHFGSDKDKSFKDYALEGARFGMEVLQAESYVKNDITISSSVIRAFLGKASLEMVKRCLGRSYALSGKIVKGQQLGRTIGFPTANIAVENCFKMIPPGGVYAVWAKTEGKTYPAMLNIGCRPTVNDNQIFTIEAHLLGFSGDLYGKIMCVSFESYLRSEVKFSSLQELKNQLKKDALEAEQKLAL